MGKAVGKVWNDISGASAAADAAQGAAEAQSAEARRQFNLTQQNIDKAVQMANSPQEINALEKSLQAQERSLSQQRRLFEALDPAILEASKQALSLLKGEEAKALNPIRNQRQRQREKLLNRLRETLGPGAETSTAGIQALTQFDTQTDELMTGAQQQSLGSLFEMGQSGAVNRGQLNQGIGQMANIGSAFGNIASRKAQTQLGGAQALAQSGQGLVQTAGSQFVGDQLRAQSQQQLMGSIVQAGATAGFNRLFAPSGGGGKKEQ